jgi:F0F1-type ATP synthase assembly protein I
VSDPDTSRDDVTTESSMHVPNRDVITGAFSKNADLISYIISGLSIGLLLDWFLSTGPTMVIVWSVAGVAIGFWRLWQGSAVLDDEGRRRSHGV